MTRDQQRVVSYLAHILEAIERIGRYTDGMDGAAFLSNGLVQDAVIRNLEIIGEASNNIEKHHPDFAAAHPELPPSFAYQMRQRSGAWLFQGGFRDRLENGAKRSSRTACNGRARASRRVSIRRWRLSVPMTDNRWL